MKLGMKIGLGIGGLALLGCCGIGGCTAVLSGGDDATTGTGAAVATAAAEGAKAGAAVGTGTPTPVATVEGAAATTKPPAPPKPATPTIEDGTWTVGDDIPAGTYKVREPISDGLCYWSITKTGSNGADIVQNDLGGKGRPSVVLKKGQDFETARCGTWVKTK
ncbi:hypothetical protein O7635_29520 [Asanoa sp. WMMD1127]|uniref:hypothetical protein n=1 Tax=Asanoa sp. WMMD1127 TaxID=3016107 RepID=UPI0024175006|nr:hypothetical protein [Asanoa sp. WMMD1127]MDG4826009.1 hypothetical protein [Asanoa sp. WMMD1127]